MRLLLSLALFVVDRGARRRGDVDRLRGGIFLGSVHRIDARTSDAIAVALGNDAPIDVARVVLEEAVERLPPGLTP